MRISGLSGGLGPGCLGFLGTVAGGARWQAPKPDLRSILRANFPTPDAATPMPSADTRKSRGKQKEGGKLKSRQRKLVPPSKSPLVMLLTKRSPLPLPHDWIWLPY